MHRRIQFPRTHAIEVLLGLIQPSEDIPENVQEAFFLDKVRGPYTISG